MGECTITLMDTFCLSNTHTFTHFNLTGTWEVELGHFGKVKWPVQGMQIHDNGRSSSIHTSPPAIPISERAPNRQPGHHKSLNELGIYSANSTRKY